VARSAAAGSGPRQLILLGALATACVLARAAPPPDAAGAPGKAQPVQTAQSTPNGAAAAARKPAATQGKRNGDTPDAAVLEYLGEFDEAGDGLDAMGLAGDDADTTKPAQGGRR